MNCLLCLSGNVKELGNVGIRPVSVTSDSNLSPRYAKLYFCKDCGHIQKLYDEDTITAVSCLYDNYNPHYLSDGNEQLVFPGDLPPRPRTYHVIEKCVSLLPKTGLLLDIGTGNGAVLKSASKLLPEWRLSAFDINNLYEKDVSKNLNFDAFYCEKLDNIPVEKFNLVVLWHVLEHVDNPVNLISNLKDKLKDDGYMLVQVPDISRNPFDLAVIDHRSHFTINRLIEFFHLLGFMIVANGNNWIHNCLTLLLKKGGSRKDKTSSGIEYSSAEIHFNWLNEMIDNFEQAIKGSDYAIFGTGMASILLFGQLSMPPLFFIDEDTRKEGRSIKNIPIVAPGNIKDSNLNIVMPFLHDTGLNIAQRLQEKYAACVSTNFILTQSCIERVNEGD